MPTIKVMAPANKVPNLTKLKYPCYVQPKIPGQRALYEPGKGLLTPEGSLLPENLAKGLLNALEGRLKYVLDGVVGSDGKFTVIDCLTVEDWASKTNKSTYEKRLKKVRELLNEFVVDYTRIIDVPTDVVENPMEIKALYKKWLTRGYKGVIIRATEANYVWGRSTIKAGEMLKLETET